MGQHLLLQQLMPWLLFHRLTLLTLNYLIELTFSFSLSSFPYRNHDSKINVVVGGEDVGPIYVPKKSNLISCDIKLDPIRSDIMKHQIRPKLSDIKWYHVKSNLIWYRIMSYRIRSNPISCYIRLDPTYLTSNDIRSNWIQSKCYVISDPIWSDIT